MNSANIKNLSEAELLGNLKATIKTVEGYIRGIETIIEELESREKFKIQDLTQ